MDSEKLEKYSSAITLSDMEVFVFPELMYSLVLANIMSPIIWQWRQEDCFVKLEGKSPYRKLLRLRQYIMDNYEFNLDLNTWGLTNKDSQSKRFDKYISPDVLAASNALFGYEGDKYYFDVDIRRHFGLDQYDSDIIPYWKTETVEAMTAFRKKPGYATGAGECVSLSTLYAAAAFIVCGIPLEDIYMVLTPLHSQNFIDISDGVLTNNRRLVTKAMWFNGTEISNKAQRALRYEQITIIAHCSGYAHCIYPQATIDRKVYDKFTGLLKGFLTEKLNPLIFANFLRSQSGYQKYFQFCRHLRGEQMFVMAEELFGYEHGSRFRIADETFDKLLEEVSDEDYSRYKFDYRLCCEQLMHFVNENGIDVLSDSGRAKLAEYLAPFVPDSKKLVAELADFIHLEPKLPAAGKQYATVEPLRISPGWTREQIIEYLRGKRQTVAAADLAFYAYRDMESCDWEPFVRAAIDRSPVSIEAAKDLTLEQVYQNLMAMPNESIYDRKRLAQPDEVQNYGTGDGVEKAFLLANVICAKEADRCVRISIDNSSVIVKADKDYLFKSTKDLKKEITAAE